METIDVKQGVWPVSDNTVILMPTMGYGSMPDSPAIKEALSKRNIEVCAPDLSDRSTYYSVPWEKVRLVELRDMRGGLSDFQTFLHIRASISAQILSVQGAVERVPFVPAQPVTDWIYNKTNYFEYLNAQDINGLWTRTFYTTLDDDLLQDHRMALIGLIMISEPSKFVLKPSLGALASSLVMIETKVSGSSGDEVTASAIHYLSDGQRTIYDRLDQKSINNFLKDYLSGLGKQYSDAMFQPFVPNEETSAVYIGGEPHFVRREVGPYHIAHENFEGKNELLSDDQVEEDIREFAQTVFDALPEITRQSPYLRVDVMRTKKTNELVLGEIEGAAATRLWLEESGRAEEYADLLVSLIPALN